MLTGRVLHSPAQSGILGTKYWCHCHPVFLQPRRGYRPFSPALQGRDASGPGRDTERQRRWY